MTTLHEHSRRDILLSTIWRTEWPTALAPRLFSMNSTSASVGWTISRVRLGPFTLLTYRRGNEITNGFGMLQSLAEVWRMDGFPSTEGWLGLGGYADHINGVLGVFSSLAWGYVWGASRVFFSTSVVGGAWTDGKERSGHDTSLFCFLFCCCYVGRGSGFGWLGGRDGEERETKDGVPMGIANLERSGGHIGLRGWPRRVVGCWREVSGLVQGCMKESGGWLIPRGDGPRGLEGWTLVNEESSLGKETTCLQYSGDRGIALVEAGVLFALMDGARRNDSTH